MPRIAVRHVDCWWRRPQLVPLVQATVLPWQFGHAEHPGPIVLAVRDLEAVVVVVVEEHGLGDQEVLQVAVPAQLVPGQHHHHQLGVADRHQLSHVVLPLVDVGHLHAHGLAHHLDHEGPLEDEVLRRLLAQVLEVVVGVLVLHHLLELARGGRQEQLPVLHVLVEAVPAEVGDHDLGGVVEVQVDPQPHRPGLDLLLVEPGRPAHRLKVQADPHVQGQRRVLHQLLAGPVEVVVVHDVVHQPAVLQGGVLPDLHELRGPVPGLDHLEQHVDQVLLDLDRVRLHDVGPGLHDVLVVLDRGQEAVHLLLDEAAVQAELRAGADAPQVLQVVAVELLVHRLEQVHEQVQVVLVVVLLEGGAQGAVVRLALDQVVEVVQILEQRVAGHAHGEPVVAVVEVRHVEHEHEDLDVHRRQHLPDRLVLQVLLDRDLGGVHGVGHGQLEHPHLVLVDLHLSLSLRL